MEHRSRRTIWAGHETRMGEMRNAYDILVGIPEGKRPLGRPRHRCEDNTRTEFTKIGWEGVDWIHLARDRDQWRALVNTVMKLKVNLLTRGVTISFSRRTLLYEVSYSVRQSPETVHVLVRVQVSKPAMLFYNFDVMYVLKFVMSV
jgi:hypothetical protein